MSSRGELAKLAMYAKGTAGIEAADVAAIVFSVADGKLRLVDMFGPGGASYANPPDRLTPAEQAYLKDVFRIAEQRFAMDRCQPG